MGTPATGSRTSWSTRIYTGTSCTGCSHVRNLIRDILVGGGYQVTAVANGTEALTAAGAENFDLLITDLVMPGLSGAEVVKRLRKRQPTIPVVFVSGYAREALDETMLNTTTRFLAKPFPAANLIELIRTTLDDASLDKPAANRAALSLAGYPKPLDIA